MLNHKNLVIFDWEGTLIGPNSQRLSLKVQNLIGSLYHHEFLLAIATNAYYAVVEKALFAVGMHKHFVTIQSCDRFEPKPDPAMLTDLMHLTNMSAKQCILVGDSTSDLKAANRAGIDAIGVCQTPYDHALFEPYKPYALINEIAEIKELHL